MRHGRKLRFPSAKVRAAAGPEPKVRPGPVVTAGIAASFVAVALVLVRVDNASLRVLGTILAVFGITAPPILRAGACPEAWGPSEMRWGGLQQDAQSAAPL